MTFKALIIRAQKVKLLAMDVDGVLTRGDVLVLESGEEVKLWSSKDRFGIAMVRERKDPLLFAWITGRSSPSVLRCAKELGIHHVIQKCHDKKDALEKILKQYGLSFSQTAFIGDDLLDLPPMRAVGFSACPADAIPDVKKSSHYISPFGGGKGAVRDVLEFVLKAQRRWKPLVASFYQ